jgi:hypothetical protein
MSRVLSKKDVVKRLMEDWGGRFSAELGIDIESGRSEEIFKWFLASVLFGTRIGQNVAIQTYKEFEKRGVLTPDDILRTGWDSLVEILDAGGYVRYDYKTATKLLEIAETLNKHYGGDLNKLHEKSRDPRDLESKLAQFKGVGPVTVNIFLRELREVWEKADPLPGALVIAAARSLGFTNLEGRDDEERKKVLLDLERVWEQEDLPYHFSDFEAALVKFGTEQRRKKRL